MYPNIKRKHWVLFTSCLRLLIVPGLPATNACTDSAAVRSQSQVPANRASSDSELSVPFPYTWSLAWGLLWNLHKVGVGHPWILPSAWRGSSQAPATLLLPRLLPRLLAAAQRPLCRASLIPLKQEPSFCSLINPGTFAYQVPFTLSSSKAIFVPIEYNYYQVQCLARLVV